MKKIIKYLLLIVSITTMMIISASVASAAEIVDNGQCGGNVTWTLDDEGTLTISGNSKIKDYEFVWNVPWYDYRESITEVIVNEGVTGLGRYAFNECRNIEKVTLPDSLTILGSYAFAGCSSLESIMLPDSVTIISDCVFVNCDKLSEIEIPSGVTSIERYAFGSCSSLTSITLPDGVTDIGEGAFSSCSNLVEIIIPNSVTSIDVSAFFNCSSLSEITIPDSVINVGDCMFEQCSNLTRVTLPNNLTSIGGAMFSGCSCLVEIVIPDSVETIEDNAFLNCSSLEEIAIPSLVTIIGDGAFLNCSSLSEITIPDSVISIGYCAFANCTGLTKLTIPDSVTTISSCAFSGCSQLESIIIPASVTSIGDSVFMSSGVKKVFFEGDKPSIGSSCFSTTRIAYYPCNNPTWEGLNPEVYQKKHNLTKIDEITGSCEKEGNIAYWKCTACGCYYSDNAANNEIDENSWIIPAGHEMIKVESKKESCTQNGNSEYWHCNRCGNYYNDESGNTPIEKNSWIIPAVGHQWDSGTITKKATCTVAGIKTFKCSTCGVTKTQSIAATGHSWRHKTVKATLSKSGSEYDICTVCSAKKNTKTIYYPKTFKLSTTAYTYSGAVKKPTVTVKNSNGGTIGLTNNYSVSYSNNKYVGKATAKITFKGKYSGTKSLTFKINPKGTSLSKVTAKKKAFTVAWKKQATQTTGYQIQYSLSSSFASGNKLVTVGKTGTTSKTISKLKAKKTYYVRVRTYKTVSGTKYYSAWSAKKYVKTK